MAVIYTRGFKDKAHDLEKLADQASAPLMAQYMGTYIKSFSKVIDNVLTVDFTRAIEEGTAKWNNEEPLRIELEKGNRGTTYLRIKRYELYPFQEPETGRIKARADAKKMKASVISSTKELEAFLTQNKYNPGNLDLGKAAIMIREASQGSAQAEEGMKEHVNAFRERISSLNEKIAGARSDAALQETQLKKKEAQFEKMRVDFESLKQRKDTSETAFQQTQASLHEIKITHESIIIKTSLATTKGSQTPAEASAEAIIDKLEEVRNDARTQHSSSTTDVINYQVAGESTTQAVTDARIIAVRLISFINEGDSVRVKMAFRVRIALEEKKKETDRGIADRFFGTSSADEPPQKSADREPPPKPVAKAAPVRDITRSDDDFSPPPARTKAASEKPKATTKGLASAVSNEFLFNLIGARISGSELTFIVEATNNAAMTKYVTLYDETTGRYKRSSMTDEAGKTHEVNEVYLWRGEQKTPARDAYRGIPVEPGQTVTTQLIFKKMPSRLRTVKLLTLHPFTAVRIMFFKWRDEDLVFRNIPVRR